MANHFMPGALVQGVVTGHPSVTSHRVDGVCTLLGVRKDHGRICHCSMRIPGCVALLSQPSQLGFPILGIAMLCAVLFTPTVGIDSEYETTSPPDTGPLQGARNVPIPQPQTRCIAAGVPDEGRNLTAPRPPAYLPALPGHVSYCACSGALCPFRAEGADGQPNWSLGSRAGWGDQRNGRKILLMAIPCPKSARFIIWGSSHATDALGTENCSQKAGRTM
jgi:hypothetical protein